MFNLLPQVFQSTPFNFTMIEEQPVLTILTTLHATDADSTISEYQLIDAEDDDNGSEFFEINNVTGKWESFFCKVVGLPQTSDKNSFCEFISHAQQCISWNLFEKALLDVNKNPYLSN